MKFNSHSTAYLRICRAVLLGFAFFALAQMPARAAPQAIITVDTPLDTLLDDGYCSLREAITNANDNFTTFSDCMPGSGADIIVVPAGTYTLTIAGAGEDANATGDLDITDSVTINGAGAGSTIIRAHATPGSGIDRVFHIAAGITVSISDVTIANGKCTDCGGGGILNNGTLTVTNSTFSGNYTIGSDGGGFYNNGTVTVMNNTFSGNYAVGTYNCVPVCASYGGYGGGIANGGPLTVTNSTFSGNSATQGCTTYSGGQGGGIFNASGLTVTNSTFSGNFSYHPGCDTSSGGGIHNYYGTLYLKNTILANSVFSRDCYNESGNTISANINNLIETNGPSGHMCGTPAVTSDPSLGSLADNGGATQTFALLAGSPAIDAGDNTTCAAAPVSGLDQRGVPRPQGAYCDIGAYEGRYIFLPLIFR